MAFLAPLIAPLIPGIAALGLIGEGIVGIGLSFGVSYLAKALQPKSTTSAMATTGMQLSLSYNPNGARQIPIGICASAGTMTYHNTYGPNGNDYVQIVFRLGDLPCGDLVGVYANGKKLTLESHVSTANVSGRTVSQYPGAMWIRYFNGDWDQDADADLVAHASGATFSSSNRGRGICYASVTLKFDPKLFTNGIPAFVWVFEGAKLYDWRQDSTAGGDGNQRWGDENTYAFNDNPMVVANNWYRGITVNGSPLAGMNVPADFLPRDVWTAAANACDESVSLKDGGTQKRYVVSGIIGTDADNTTVIRDLMTSAAASMVDASGIFKPYPGVAQSPIIEITDADFMGLDAITYAPKRSRASLVNSVFGSFNDPDQMYQSAALPPRISPDDIAADGGIQLPQNYALSYVSVQQQGQRILEIFRRNGRFQRNVQGSLRPGCMMVEAGDWLSWTSDRYGFESMLFKVVQGSVNRNGTVPVELAETSAKIFGWVPGTDELNPLAPREVGSGGEAFSTVRNPAVEGLLLNDEDTGVQTPALRVTWTPVDDATVVNLIISYRKVGDVAVMKRTVLKPLFGEDIIVAGVQGDLRYEVQIDMVTLPVRTTVSTAWVQMESATGSQVVSVAATANNIPDQIVTPPKLSDQVLMELRLATAKAAIQASVARQIEEAYAWAKQAAETALSGRLEAYAQGARLTQEITQRTDGDTALASLVQTAVTWINENAATVTEVIESLDGVSARWGAQVSIAANGKPYVTGLVRLDGSADGSSFLIGASKLALFDPNVNDGDPVDMVTVVPDPAHPGSYLMRLNGDMIANAIRAGLVEVENLKALSSSFGDMTCSGIQRSANGKKVINWDTGQEWVDA